MNTITPTEQLARINRVLVAHTNHTFHPMRDGFWRLARSADYWLRFEPYLPYLVDRWQVFVKPDAWVRDLPAGPSSDEFSSAVDAVAYLISMAEMAATQQRIESLLRQADQEIAGLTRSHEDTKKALPHG